MLLLKMRLSTLGVLICAGALSACSLNTEVTGVGQVSTYSGDNQSAPAGTAFPEPLAVQVVSQFGEPMENVQVTWTIAAGGGSLSSTTAASGGSLSSTITLTDVNGIASVSYTAGPIAGHAAITAQVNGVEPLTFDETIT